MENFTLLTGAINGSIILFSSVLQSQSVPWSDILLTLEESAKNQKYSVHSFTVKKSGG